MRVDHTTGRLLRVALAATALAGCGGEGSAAGRLSGTTHSGGDLPAVLATVGGEPITMEDVHARAGDELGRLELQYLTARHKVVDSTLETLVRERVLFGEARARGRSVEDLILDEAGPGLTASDAEIAAWYEDNRARVGNRPLDQVRSQIADHLREERRNEAMARLEERLFRENDVRIHLEPIRLEFDNAKAPFTGPADAPVTLVEFSDFQCPYCARVAPTLKQVEREFEGRVRIVYRHFPLMSIHPFAFKAAEASMCAHDQGQFWPMHDLIYQEQNRITVSDLKEKARRLGLGQREFDGCLDSGRYAELVQQDLADGQRAGVNGTPALFVNGVPVAGGAASFDALAEAVRRELARGSE
jgi:protein-disulfide isomerase